MIVDGTAARHAFAQGPMPQRGELLLVRPEPLKITRDSSFSCQGICSSIYSFNDFAATPVRKVKARPPLLFDMAQPAPSPPTEQASPPPGMISIPVWQGIDDEDTRSDIPLVAFRLIKPSAQVQELRW